MDRVHPSSGTALPEVPGFEVLDRIGAGGMGEVYRATQLSLQRTVAIKFLDPALDSPDSQPAFLRESRLMAALAHPNVVTIFDCGESDGRKFLIMEHVPGEPLRARMKPNVPWKIADAASLLDTIAHALTFIHGQGVLHLDLKPENILCHENGTIKITDFGLSVPAPGANTLAEGRSHSGTVDYSAPEQRFGLPVDARSDVFSVSVLAYELLSGRLPGRVFAPATEFNQRLPTAVDDVLRRGLERRAADRFATVEELRLALTAALKQRPPRRRRLTWVAVAVLTVALLGGLALALPGPKQHVALPVPTTPAAVEAPRMRGWWLHEEPEERGWALADLGMGPGALVQSVPVGGAKPEAILDLPSWPKPRPVFVFSAPGGIGFVHPLTDPNLPARIVQDWPRLQRWTVSAGDNLIRNGTFDGSELKEWGIWDYARGSEMRRQVRVGLPAGEVVNTAVCFENADEGRAQHGLVIFQPVPLLPEDPTVLVLRLRARTESGTGRLCLMPHFPYQVPAEDTSKAAVRLRARAERMVPDRTDPLPDRYLHSLRDWVVPPRDWQTYYVIWEMPTFAPRTHHRNLDIWYTGTGKVWVDDVELFTWRAGKP